MHIVTKSEPLLSVRRMPSRQEYEADIIATADSFQAVVFLSSADAHVYNRGNRFFRAGLRTALTDAKADAEEVYNRLKDRLVLVYAIKGKAQHFVLVASYNKRGWSEPKR